MNPRVCGYSPRVMNGSPMRSAVGCVIACGALVVGPSLVGTAVARADLLGIGGGGGGIDVLGIDLLGGGGTKKSGGAGGPVQFGAVSNAPSTRSVVIRAEGRAAQPIAEPLPAASVVPDAYTPATMLGVPLVEALPVAPAAPSPPAAVPLAVSPLLPAAPVIRPPAPQGLTIPSTSAPGPGRPLAPADSLRPPVKVPDSFRVGYAEYLRTATISDLLAAAVPGVVGIAGFTLVGAFAGYRQAKTVQRALLAPVPTSILL